jgi:hypothetical protein
MACPVCGLNPANCTPHPPVDLVVAAGNIHQLRAV